MAQMQRPDGSVPVSQGLTEPAWATSYAMMLWSALPDYRQSELRARALLLTSKGEVLQESQNADKIIGHDPTLVGWPWVAGTHSWLEPTALAILALCRLGLTDHPRVKAGRQLIVDRAVGGGGWNYGNKSVFGTGLRPQPGPTGLALLALAAAGDRSPAAARAVGYLVDALRSLRSPVSLGWGILGLRAHRALPPASDSWMQESHARCTGRPDAAMGLALLLLASSEPALGLLIGPASRPA
jgi:hypothetical protein